MVVLGCMIIVNPVFYSWRYCGYFDFSGYNTLYGLCLIMAGILMLANSERKENGKKDE